MRVFSKVLLTLSCIALLTILSPNSKADEWNKETIVSFDQPVEIPGHVLSPGTYDFKLEETLSDRNVVEIWSKDADRLVAIVTTIPAERVGAVDTAVFTFEQRNAQSPEAVKDWFYPGDLTGQEFLYPSVHTESPSSAPLR